MITTLENSAYFKTLKSFRENQLLLNTFKIHILVTINHHLLLIISGLSPSFHERKGLKVVY